MLAITLFSIFFKKFYFKALTNLGLRDNLISTRQNLCSGVENLLLLSRGNKLSRLRLFFCLLLSSRYGGLTGQLRLADPRFSISTPVIPPPSQVESEKVVGHQNLSRITAMNHKFNGATPCTPKKLAKQLLIESAKLLSHKQRQALLDIVQTLYQLEINTSKDISLHVETEQPFQTATPSYEFQDEYNQEYWSGQHCNAYTQEYPEDWLRRTQQRPRPKSPNTTY